MLQACLIMALIGGFAGCSGSGETTGVDLAPEPEVTGDVTAEVTSPDTEGVDTVGCLSDLNCEYLEDQAGPCEIPVCEDGICVLGAGMDGIVCSDGNPCTLWDLCAGGECTAGDLLDCDDAEVCTADFCDPDSGNCVYAFLDGDPCDDESVCTTGDVCAGGACGGEEIECLDDDPCTADGCDAEDGCVFPVMDDGAVCDDGNPCTDGDACLDGICGSSGLTSCNDGNPCTADGCDELLGCVNDPLTGDPCNDGNSCTAGDACVDGVCVGGDNTCLCAVDEDCADFEDGDLCNGTLVCTDDECIPDPDTVVECTPSSNPCLTTTCDPGTGECVDANLDDGSPCDDESLCTDGDACVEGVCEGLLLYCDDEDPCTDDECDPALGCTHSPLSGDPCQDGDPCTSDDLCEDGICVPGQSVCDCEEDADCDEFDDDNPCTGTYVCVDNVCLVDPGTVVFCADAVGSGCMKNQCDPDSGQCELTAQPDETPCDDEDVCTEYDACVAGTCSGVAVLCDDGNPCTDNLCDPAAGGCVTVDNNMACDDGDACTEDDLCVAGNCVGSEISCDDGNSCTFDLCDDEAGCTNSLKDGPCDDGDVCTLTDACVDGTCVGSDPQDCDDGNECTTDLCDPQGGCLNKLEDGPCDDGDACTDGDWCVDGACQEGQEISCDDDNPCTADSCNAVSGCLNDPLDGIACTTGDPCLTSGVCVTGKCVESPDCEDGDACTTGDACQDGVCVGGPPPDCDDQLVCTLDSCAPDLGCVNDPGPLDGISCDDGDACSLGDLCDDGSCVGAGDLDCEDDNSCTTDNCDTELGCVHTPAAGGCDDGDPCTVQDACLDGICAGAPLDCSDGDPCTHDLCDPAQGCFHPPVSEGEHVPCDDDDLCTLVDLCAGGVCVGGNPIDCDDEIPCTVDSCDPDTGDCVYQEIDDSCDDGNLCTDDSCVAAQGGCISEDNSVPCEDGNPCTDGDLCGGGSCQPGASICECETTADCADEEDGDACNGTLICVGNDCVVDPDTVVTCDSGGDTACLKNTCLPATGTCVPTAEPDGTVCDDDLVCTTDDACEGGICAGDELTCPQDDNPCTLDVCDPAQGCMSTFVTGSCDDDDGCTVSDTCTAGECAGQPYECDDGNICTADFCTLLNGAPQCFYQNENGKDCDDGSVCTIDDICTGGTCVGDAISCDDDNICTDDACDPAGGCQYSFNTTLCDDGEACTIGDVCSAGICTGTDKDCDDNNVCTDDACDPSSGACVYAYNTAACNDDDVCTVDDACVLGACVGDELDCDDEDPCTADLCLSSAGCIHTFTPGAPCDDGELCTDGDVCGGDGGCVGTTVPGCCHGDDDCTTGYECNETSCQDNWCVAEVLDCADGNECTADTCSAGDCVHIPFGEDGAVIYTEDFDGAGDHGWDTWLGDEGTTEVYWSVSSTRSHSAPNSLYGGNPEAQSYDFGTVDAWAASPWIRLPSDVPLEISFRYWTDFQEDSYQYDWVDVYIEDQDQGPVTAGDRISASTEGAWEVWSVSGEELSGFSGEEVRILLRFATVDGISNAAEGVYVDDVTVVAGEKDGCCEFDSDCFDPDLCTEDLCSGTWACTSEDVFGSYLWEIFPDEEIPQSWALTSTNPALFWSVQPFRSVSSRYSFYGGNPGTQTYNHDAGSFAALSPTIDLENAVAPVLRFDLFADFDDASCENDYFQVILVKQIGIGVQIPVYTRCDGTDGDFTSVEVDLSAHTGATVQLRFYVAVNKENNSAEGVYVDDIRVDEEGLEDPGCCASDSECVDDDTCTTDVCIGETGAGVCLNLPMPLVEDDFDDGDSDGWSINAGDNWGDKWFVSDEDAVSQPFSLQASNQTSSSLPYSSWTTADSPALTVSAMPSQDMSLVAEYSRTVVMGINGGQEVSLEVQWQYRTADGGYWTTGGNLEVLSGPSSWTNKSYPITPSGAIHQIRIRFKYSQTCQGLQNCDARANTDDFFLGWDGCM